MAITQDRAEAAPPVGYGELVRQNHNFRNLWFGQIISLLGDWFNLIASAALIGELTHSGLAVGSLFVVRMLAPFLISPIAGVAADRYNRKWILIITDLVRAVVVFGFLFVREAGDLWLLYTLTAIQLGVSGFFFPARNAILPDIVAPRELGAANALSSATWSVMLALGAALGGLVSGAWGIQPAFVIDGFTFFASAWFIWRIVLAPRAELAGPKDARRGLAPICGRAALSGPARRRAADYAAQGGQCADSFVRLPGHPGGHCATDFYIRRRRRH
ncbi:MAG: MFS transporter [Caldilineaceae bacterium]